MAVDNQDDPIRAGNGKRIGAKRGSNRYRPIAITLLSLVMLASSSMLYGAGPVHTERKYWIGKNISQAEKEFGTPTSSEQLIETGGMLVIYARKRDPVHFVFETDSGGTIIKAARVE